MKHHPGVRDNSYFANPLFNLRNGESLGLAASAPCQRAKPPMPSPSRDMEPALERRGGGVWWIEPENGS